MTHAPLKYRVEDGTAWLILNRPERLNALEPAMVRLLSDAIQAVETDDRVRVVVVSGRGSAFCAGGDLLNLVDGNGDIDLGDLSAYVRDAASVIERVAALEQPVIAAVNGLAVGAGLELVLACDIVVASERARFGDGHGNYGLVPGGGGTARLARTVGPRVAKYLALTGVSMAACDLVPLGLVNEIVDHEMLAERVAELARHVSSRSRSANTHVKRLIDDSFEQSMASALRAERAALISQAYGADMQEGLVAFREKRAPHFLGSPGPAVPWRPIDPVDSDESSRRTALFDSPDVTTQHAEVPR